VLMGFSGVFRVCRVFPCVRLGLSSAEKLTSVSPCRRGAADQALHTRGGGGRGLHSSTSQLNLSRF